MSRRLIPASAIVAILATALLVVTACTEELQPTSTPRSFNPTAAPAATQSPATVTPTTASGAVTPTATVAAPSGNVENGKTLFAEKACSGCHAITTSKLVGPGLAGIGDRSGSTVSGLSADAYLEQSIRDPGAFVVPSFPPNVMPLTFKDMPASEVADLIAYLKTLK